MNELQYKVEKVALRQFIVTCVGGEGIPEDTIGKTSEGRKRASACYGLHNMVPSGWVGSFKKVHSAPYIQTYKNDPQAEEKAEARKEQYKAQLRQKSGNRRSILNRNGASA